MWSDELAAVAEEAGWSEPELSRWRATPIAVVARCDETALVVAGRLLGHSPSEDLAAEAGRRCPCGHGVLPSAGETA